MHGVYVCGKQFRVVNLMKIKPKPQRGRGRYIDENENRCQTQRANIARVKSFFFGEPNIVVCELSFIVFGIFSRIVSGFVCVCVFLFTLQTFTLNTLSIIEIYHKNRYHCYYSRCDMLGASVFFFFADRSQFH